MNTQAQIFLTILAGWMNREQQMMIEYLLEENKILKEQFDKTGKKQKLTNQQRRELARKGRILGWQQLLEYASIATPQTIYAWHRKFVALKYTAKRKIYTEKQQRMTVIRELCVKFATENPTRGYGRIQGALANVGYVKHYHHERNHQGLDILIPMPYVSQNHDKKQPITKSERLGGLLNYTYRESETKNGMEEPRAA